MASPLYSRYVPSKSNKTPLHNAIACANLAPNFTSTSQSTPPEEPLSQPLSTHVMKTEQNKARKRKREGNDSKFDNRTRQKESEEKDSTSRHKTLLKKKDRAVKTSDKLARTVPIAQEEDIEIHPLEPLPQPEQAVRSAILDISSTSNTPLPFPILVPVGTGASFTKLGIPNAVANFLQSKGFDEAFPIQSAMIPLLLSQRQGQIGDLLVSAPPGSGKTLGYVLPMIADISQRSIPKLRAVIIVPTRDLLYQTHAVCEIGASAFAGRGRRRVRIGTACGDVVYQKEVEYLMSGEKIYDPVNSRKRDQLPNDKWCCSDYETDTENQTSSRNETDKAPLSYIMEYTSKFDILICTPGRLVQHLRETNGFELKYVDWLVIDEVDRILNQTYQALIKTVMSSLSSGLERTRIKTKILLSATMSTDAGELSALKLHNPKFLVLGQPNPVSSLDRRMVSDLGYVMSQTLKEFIIHLKQSDDKPIELVKLLEKEKMFDNDNEPNTARGALIFTNSNESAHRLGRLLQLLRPNMVTRIGIITSNVAKSGRNQMLRDFEDRKVSIIVASDIMSRGIDLPSLGSVINYDVPTNPTSYVHRVGRTARAGKEGKAWTLFEGNKIQLERFRAGRNISLMSLEQDATSREALEAALMSLAKEAGNG